MQRLIPGGGIILLMLILMACTTWPDSYLKTATNHATQDEIAKELGPPHLTQALSTGGAVWLYGFTNTSGSVGCTAYILTFDRERMLRHWQWQPTCPQGFRF